MGTTPSTPKDFYFYDHIGSHFSWCPFYKINPENATSMSIIKKGRIGKYNINNILFLDI